MKLRQSLLDGDGVCRSRNGDHLGRGRSRAARLWVALAGSAAALCSSAEIKVSESGSDVVIEVTGSETYAEAITGTKNLVKRGNGTLTLTGVNTFTGDITVEAGTLACNNCWTAYGQSGNTAKVNVWEGAQIDISKGFNPSGGWTATLGKEFHIAGTGPDGQGAIVRYSTGSGNQDKVYLSGKICLEGDATIRSTSYMGWGSIYPNGHRLTKAGGKFWWMNKSVNAPNGGSLRIADTAEFSIQQNPTLSGSDASALEFASGGTFSVIDKNKAVEMPVVGLGALTLSVPAGGEMSFDKKVTVASNVTAKVNGPMTFNDRLKVGSSAIGGGLTVSGASTLGVHGGLTVERHPSEWWSGRFGVEGGAAVTLDGGKASTNRYTEVRKGSLALTGTNTKLSTVLATFVTGASKTENATLSILDGAALSMETGTYVNLGTSPWVTSAWGTLVVAGADSNLSTPQLYLGAESSKPAGRKMHGVLRQEAGTVSVSGTFEMANVSSCYGAILKSGGTLSAASGIKLGSAGDAVFYQSAGRTAAGLTMADGGTSVAWLTGGNLDGTVAAFVTDAAPSGTRSLVALEDGAVLYGSGHNVFAGKAGTEAILAVNSGATFSGGRLRKDDAATGKFYWSLDGGILEVTYGGDWNNDVAAQTPDDVLVHEGGVVVHRDVGSGGNSTSINTGFMAPTGKIVSAITLPPEALADDKYLGPPVVVINGAGHGAAAVALYDPATRKLTGIKVVAKGTGYDDNTTATVKTSDLDSATYACTVTMADAPTTGAGLVKRGTGGWALKKANTYHGPTTVEQGLLSVEQASALPAGTSLVVSNTAAIKLASGVVPTVASLAGAGSITGAVTVAESLVLTAKAGETLTLTGKLLLADGVTVSLPNGVDGLDDKKANVVLTAENGIELSGNVTWPTLPADWKIALRGNQIRVSKRRGLFVMVK